MKFLLALLFISGILISCGSSTESNDEIAETETPTVESRYSYSSSFEDADSENLAIVRGWNSSIVAGDLDKAFSYLADSIDILMYDGTYLNTSKDSMRTIVSSMLELWEAVSVDFLAAASVRSTDQNETWVLSYTDESMSTAEGEDRSVIHELYKIEGGKIRSVLQYRQELAESDKGEGEAQDGEYAYSGHFEIMEDTNVGTVEGWVDAIVDKNWDKAGDFLADSISIIFPDGSELIATSDSLISRLSNSLREVDYEINETGIIPMRSTVQNDEWVLTWSSEQQKRGDEINSWVSHRAYLLVDGKIAFVRQFSRSVPE